MKQKFYTILCALLSATAMKAQTELFVGAESALDIKANTIFSAGGLTLQPSIDYRFSNTEMVKANEASNYTTQTYVSGVARFTNIAPFSGIVRIQYSADGLNGIPENVLGIKTHTGQLWKSLPTLLRDQTMKMVTSEPVSDLYFFEIVLADEMLSLPLAWGRVEGLRINEAVRVSWSTRSEEAVSHFQIERSTDSRNWVPVGNRVEARNQSGEQHYQGLDLNAPSGRIFYRVRQYDLDGRSTYSAIVAVAGIGEALEIQVFPNPSIRDFRIVGVGASSILTVDLYDTRGARLKSWTGGLTEYDIQSLASGVYHVRIQLRNGEIFNKQIIKK